MFLINTKTLTGVENLRKLLDRNTDFYENIVQRDRAKYVFVEGIGCKNKTTLRKLLESEGFPVWLITEVRESYGERFVYDKKIRNRTGRGLHDRLINKPK